MSAKPCGCDEAVNWICEQCRDDLEQQREEAAMAEFFRKPSYEIEDLRQQVATLTQELKDSQAAHAEMRRRDAEHVRAIGAEKVAAERQVAALTKALEQVRLFEPQLVDTALAAVRGGSEPR